MRLDVSVLTEQFTLVLVFALFLVLGKALLMFAIARLFQYKSGESLRSAVALAQGGEFGFVLLALAGNLDLIAPQVGAIGHRRRVVLHAGVTVLIPRSDWLVRKLIRADWMMQAADLHHILVSSMLRSEHVLICGYGRSGRTLARLLERESIPVFALDLDPERVRGRRRWRRRGVWRRRQKEVLLAAGLMRAKALVITYSDTHSVDPHPASGAATAPDLTVIVRTVDDSDIDLLREAGADEVVAEVMEGSLMLASQALMALGVPLNRVLRRIRSVREERYSLFRGFFRGVTDESLAMDDAPSPPWPPSPSPRLRCRGQNLGELHLGRCACKCAR